MSFNGGGGGLDATAGDLLWLRLDTTNSPLTGRLLVADGTELLPSIAFGTDTNTGIFRRGVDQLSLVASGIERLRLTATAVEPKATIRGLGGAAGAPAYSFINDINTGAFSSGADQYDIATGGITRLRITNTLFNIFGSGTVGAPVLVIGNDLDTGLFLPAGNELGFAAGGSESLRIENTQIRVKVGGSLKVVTEGAADSGGVGFKVLIVPN